MCMDILVDRYITWVRILKSKDNLSFLAKFISSKKFYKFDRILLSVWDRSWWLSGRALTSWSGGCEFKPNLDQLWQISDVKIGSDYSFIKSSTFRSENHGSFEYDLKNRRPMSQQVWHIKEPSLLIAISAMHRSKLSSVMVTAAG